jgi:hypothetical protein
MKIRYRYIAGFTGLLLGGTALDTGEPHPMLLPLGAQDREGVAVGDAENPAKQLIGPGGTYR